MEGAGGGEKGMVQRLQTQKRTGGRPEWIKHQIKHLLFVEDVRGAGGWCPVVHCPEP